MSTARTVRSAKRAGVVAVAVALTASIGPASATAIATTAAPAAVAAPAGAGNDVAPVAAVAAGVPAAAQVTAATTAARRPVSRPATRPSRASAQRSQALAYARFTAFTLRSNQTRDMRGVERSMYRGRYYTAAAESKRLCIVRRESQGHYDAVSRGGTYRGAYQVSAALARGATWMMLKEHKALMGTDSAKRTMAKLRATPMNRWPRYWQDAAFHTIIDYRGTLSGAKHWAGGRWRC